MSRKDATSCFIFRICYITQLEFTETMFSFHSRPFRDTWKWTVGNRPPVSVFIVSFPKAFLPLNPPLCVKVATISCHAKANGWNQLWVCSLFLLLLSTHNLRFTHSLWVSHTQKYTYPLCYPLPHHSHNMTHHLLILPMAPLLPAHQLSWFTLSDLSSYISPVINESSTSCQNLKHSVQEILLAQSLSAFQTHVHWSPSQFLTQSFSHSCPFTRSSEFHCGSCHWPFLDYFTYVCVCSVISVVSDSVILWTVACQSPGSLWDSPGKNTGVGCHAFSRGPSWPRDWTSISYITGRSFTDWATKEALDYFTSTTKSHSLTLPQPLEIFPDG